MLGQIFIVGLNTKDHNIIKTLITKYHVGGLTLYKNLYKNYEEMLELINYIKALSKIANYEVLICIDEEGYRVNRLPNDFINLKSPNSLSYDLDNTKEYARLIGTILQATGININFAPVIDIKRFSDNHPIGDRAFSSNYEDVIKNSTVYIKEMKSHDVIPVVKHFPGHGATNINTHHFLPLITNTKRLFKEDIKPFQSAINNDIDLIMIGHFIIPKFGFCPSSISKKINKYLHEELNYHNLTITDDLDMGLLKLFSKPKLFKKALNSGTNLIMVKYTPTFFKDFQKLESYYQNNKLNKDNIANTINLLNNLKNKYHVTNTEIKNTIDITKINNAITNLNKKAH